MIRAARAALVGGVAALGPFLLCALPAESQSSVNRRIPIARDASIRILNLVGSITLIGWEKDTLAVTGRLAPGAGKFYFGGSGRTAKLGLYDAEGVEPEARSDIEVRVPSRARVWIKAGSAEIAVSDFAGGLDLYSVSGAIRINGSPAQVYAESMEGNVEIAGSTPFARIKTASGDIKLTGTAQDVAVTTVGGTISVQDERFDRARFESVTGDITFAGPVPRGASLTAESHSGTITLEVPADVEAGFSINTFQGKVSNQLSSARPLPARERGGQELSFETGQAGADVVIRNFKGNVVLKRQK